MSETIMESYQEQAAAESPQPAPAVFATIGAVYSDGISLIFDGETAATQKHYRCNQYCKWAAGQRVMLLRDSGTYVVCFPVGAPVFVTADMALQVVGNEKNAILFSANVSAGHFYAWADGLGWKQLDN